jgi:hypothetical protein
MMTLSQPALRLNPLLTTILDIPWGDPKSPQGHALIQRLHGVLSHTWTLLPIAACS